MLLGWALYLDSPSALAVCAGFVFYMNRFQIVPEERALLERFGNDFRAYARNTRRWV